MIAQHLNDIAYSLGVGAGLFNDGGYDNLAFPGLPLIGGRNDNLLAHTFIIRDNKPHATLSIETAYNFMCIALQHLNQGALPPVSSVNTGDLHHDPVAMQHGSHLFGGQKNILTAIFRHQKPITIRMTDDTATDQIHLFCKTISATPVLYNLAIALHGIQ